MPAVSPRQTLAKFNYGLFFSLVLALCCLSVSQQSLANSDAPAALANWKDWILAQQTQHACPWLMASDEEASQQCSWPGYLNLHQDQQGLRFSFEVEVFSPQAFVQLPGEPKYWPSQVRLKQQALGVIERDKHPFVHLKRGKHTIEGRFNWQQKPQQLTIPKRIALVNLYQQGQLQNNDRRGNQIIFSSAASHQQQSQDSLEIEVYRRLIDGIPVALSSLFKVTVSGKAREITFGRALLEDSQVLHLSTELPARLEANGDLRAQLTPGVHHIWLRSRFSQQPKRLRSSPNSEHWPKYEYISFKANTQLRQVKLSGVASVDTSQIGLPKQWADLPTYRLGQDDELFISTESRGNHSPAANQLNVKRDLWLNFNGSSLTSLDKINGDMYQSWRLNAQSDSQIGRASVDGSAVLITSDQDQQGIEIRSPNIALTAVSRISDADYFSAVGWQADAESFAARLHLPPGWRVLHASGVDRIHGTWISQWDLWDIFLMLVIIAACRKLLGNASAVLAALAFVLALHEAGSPVLAIPMLLVLMALLPISSGRFKAFLSSTTVLLSLGLILALLSFATSSFRLAIYPSLELSNLGSYQQSGRHSDAFAFDDEAEMMLESAAVSKMQDKVVKQQRSRKAVAKRQRYQVAENDRVQTGPGLPTWTWNSIQLDSSGPVNQNDKISLSYSPPWLTALWRVLAVFALSLLSLLVLSRLAKLVDFSNAKTGATAPALALGLMTLLLASQSTPLQAQQSTDFPPQYLLEQYQQRLLQAPACLPQCASLSEGRLVLEQQQLKLSFNVYADTDMALVLPDAGNQWQLKRILVDAKTASLVRLKPSQVGKKNKNANLAVAISKGLHKIELEAELISSQISLFFPLAIHNFSVKQTGWKLNGLLDGRILNKTLSLRTLKQAQTEQQNTSLKPKPAPNFFTLRRSFMFDKQWRVKTTIIRQAPRQGALSLAIPLLANEKPLSDIGVINNNIVTVQLAHQQKRLSWMSNLSASDSISLSAGDSGQYVEEWRFLPSSLWRLQYQGLTPIKTSAQASSLEPVFRPWPGEQLTVNISRPAGIAGATYTLEKAQLEFSAGKNIQRSNLQLAIRASLGEDYQFELPKDAQILSVQVNGNPLNLPSEPIVKIQLQPGLQNISVEFQQQGEIGFVSTTPQIKLPADASNLDIDYKLPYDRWPLYINGPAIGPAMLYWGVLCVIVLASLCLPLLASKTQLEMPIGISGWLLLGIGLSTVNSYGLVVIVALFFLLAARAQSIKTPALSRFKFNLMQLFIIAWITISILSLASAIPLGLLSNPEMKVVGNGSFSHAYYYYQDLVDAQNFPTVTVYSVPIFAYRVVMLLWSLWLATKLIQWANWAWQCFKTDGVWRAKSLAKKPKD